MNKNWVRRLHLWLGLAVSLPVFAWSVSGFFLALPSGAVEGEPYVVIESRRVVLTPAEAVEAVDKQLGKPCQPTAVSLEQRGQTARYSVFGKGGSFRVDAQTGEVTIPPPPSPKTRWIRHAHFFNFAGSWNTMLLLMFSLLSAFSTMSGLWLAFTSSKKRIVEVASAGRGSTPAG